MTLAPTLDERDDGDLGVDGGGVGRVQAWRG